MPLIKHRKSKTKEYYSWQQLKKRCLNSETKQYPDYGGRGITVCDEWRNSFENFFRDMGECPIGYSIDRINNNLGYFKENCRWADSKTQNRNKRDTLLVTYNNVTKPLIEFCEELNISYNMAFKRIVKRGWDVDKALTTKTKRP